MSENGKAARAKSGAAAPFVHAGELPRTIDTAERDFNDQLAKAVAAAAKH